MTLITWTSTHRGTDSKHSLQSQNEHIVSYDKRVNNFNWDIAKELLGWTNGEILNIGALCSDRICVRGKGDKLVLIWKGFGGKKHTYNFDDLRVLSNGIAQFLPGSGVKQGDRVPSVTRSGKRQRAQS